MVMRDFFYLSKLWDPWIETHTVAVAAARAAADRRAWGTSLNNLGIAYADRGDLSTAAAYYKQAHAVLSDTDDEHGLMNAACNLGWVDLYRGNHTAAFENLRDAYDFYRRGNAKRNAAITLRGIALTETELGSFSDALFHAQQAWTEAQDLGLNLDTAMSLTCIAWVHYRNGRYQEALSFYERAARECEDCGSPYETARALIGIGNVHAVTGNYSLAEEWWVQASQTHSTLNPEMVGEVRMRLLFTTEENNRG